MDGCWDVRRLTEHHQQNAAEGSGDKMVTIRGPQVHLACIFGGAQAPQPDSGFQQAPREVNVVLS